ncbi:MAG: hypothetical protein AAF602_16610 [Myxococcota bacterium]
MIAALLSVSTPASEIGPAAEPAQGWQAQVRLTPTGALFGTAIGLGVGGRVDVERWGLGGGVDWFAPGAVLARAGARWQAFDHDDDVGTFGVAVVAHGVAVTRFDGSADRWVAGLGPAIHARFRRVGVDVSAPLGLTGEPTGLEASLALLDASAFVVTGRQRRGTVRAAMTTTAALLHVTYARRTAWGHWRLGLLVAGPGATAALPLEVGWQARQPPNASRR